MPLKRKREPTFAASEKEAVIQLVDQHFHIVESKKTDVVTTKSKTEEWKKIAEEFCSISGIYPRDWVALKNCWENIKKRAKKEQTMRNQHFLGTGGGPPKKCKEDPMMERVLALLHRRATGYLNSNDDDGTNILASGSTCTPLETTWIRPTVDIYIRDVDLSESGGQMHDNDLDVNEPVAATSTADWSQYNSQMLREPINPILARSPSPSASSTPQRTHPVPLAAAVATATGPAARSSVSRRRPTVRTEKESSLNTERLKHLLNTNSRAEEEHEIEMSIKKEILEQEKLKTRQEKIRSQILEIELQKVKD